MWPMPNIGHIAKMVLNKNPYLPKRDQIIWSAKSVRPRREWPLVVFFSLAFYFYLMELSMKNQ